MQTEFPQCGIFSQSGMHNPTSLSETRDDSWLVSGAEN